MSWRIVILTLFSIVNSIRIGQIENHIMIGLTNNSLMNITRDQCICQMIQSTELVSALNYFQINQTCQLFANHINLVVIQFNLNTSFIFINQSSISITTIQSTIPPDSSSSLINVFWSFDGHLNERNLAYNSMAINNVSYSSPGITGYGSALYLNASLNQSVLINSTSYLNLSSKSFTIQLWIYPFSLLSNDRGILGQCQSFDTNRCLHLTVRNARPRISFYNNSCDSSTVLTINTWYHLTFIYNYLTSSQMIYIDGILNCIHTSSSPLQITNLTDIPLTIGYTSPYASYYFDGLIDQLSIVEWVKNSNEVLSDATLVAWYCFNNHSWDDSGPNGINGIGIKTLFDNDSLLFNKTNSYFQSSAFVLLGIDNHSYSFSIWIHPFQTKTITILHGYQNSSANDQWCLSFLIFNSQGQIQAQSRSNGGLISVIGSTIPTYVWTHLVQTYSLSNGVSLYINGSLINKSSSCDYYSSHTPIILRLGSTLNGINERCFNTTSQGEQYTGWMDEFRVYSRELTIDDVQILSIR